MDKMNLPRKVTVFPKGYDTEGTGGFQYKGKEFVRMTKSPTAFWSGKEETNFIHELSHNIWEKLSDDEKASFMRKLGKISIIDPQIRPYRDSIERIKDVIISYKKGYLKRYKMKADDKVVLKDKTPLIGATRNIIALEGFPRMVSKMITGDE